MTKVPDSSPSDRDRVTAILTLADKASEGPWRAMLAHQLGREPLPQVDVGCWTWTPMRPAGVPLDQAKADSGYIVAACNAFPDVARRLLEALDTIDRLEAENEIALGLLSDICDADASVPKHEGAIDEATAWLWGRLNGGNE